MLIADCKTVGFFLKISKEIGKACRKSLSRAYFNAQKYGLLKLHERPLNINAV